MSDNKILFYGASDDCVEFEGYISDEFYLGSDGWEGYLVGPEGERVRLRADYGVDEWELCVTTFTNHSVEWEVTLTHRPDRDSDPAVEIMVPDGTTLFVPDPTEG